MELTDEFKNTVDIKKTEIRITVHSEGDEPDTDINALPKS